MSGIGLIILGVSGFTLIVLLLVFLILLAKSKLVVRGSVTITINEEPNYSLTVPVGGKLMNILANNKIYVSTGCNGGGTCGQCKVKILEGGGDMLATERSLSRYLMPIDNIDLDNEHFQYQSGLLDPGFYNGETIYWMKSAASVCRAFGDFAPGPEFREEVDSILADDSMVISPP